MDSRPPIFRSATYFIAHRSVKCRHCRAATRVAAVLLPANHEALADDEDAANRATNGVWQTVPVPALIFGLGMLPKSAETHLRNAAPGFGWNTPEMPNDAFWSNYCEHCGTVFDDEALHCEPGDSFVPMNEADGAKISLVEIGEPFEVFAYGYSLDSLYLPVKRHS
jgi:hypothetical protein